MWSFSATHRYPDDTPTGTPSDQLPVSVIITDDDTGAGSGSVSVIVNNVAPTPSFLNISSPRQEGAPITVVGSATDPGDSGGCSAGKGAGALVALALVGAVRRRR